MQWDVFPRTNAPPFYACVLLQVSNFKRALLPRALGASRDATGDGGYAFGGRLWWLAWMLPLQRPPRGDGVHFDVPGRMGA